MEADGADWESDVVVPVEPQQKADDDDDHGPASSGRGRAKAKCKAAAKGRTRASNEPCLNCSEKRFIGFRWCQTHKRAWEAMQWQAKPAEQHGEIGAVAAFDTAMSNDSSARAAIEQGCQLNPPDKRYARKQFIDWGSFVKSHGKRTSKIDRSKCCPMTEGEFMQWATSTKALTMQEAQEWWDEHLNNPLIDRDNGVFRGRQQLWIPKEKSRIDQKETYIDAAQTEGAKTLKNPKEQDLEMLRDHVKRQKINFGDSFLTGLGSGMSSSMESPGKRLAEAVSGNGVSPSPPAAERAARTVDFDRELPRFVTTMEKDTKSLGQSMTNSLKRLHAARESLTEYGAGRAATDVALIAMVRNVQARGCLVSIWVGEGTKKLDFVSMFKPVLASPPENFPDNVKQMLQKHVDEFDSLLGDTSQAVKSLVDTNKANLPFAEDQVFVSKKGMGELRDKLLFDVAEVDAFELAKSNWKGILSAHTSLATSALKFANDVIQHIKTREAESKRQEKRQEIAGRMRRRPPMRSRRKIRSRRWCILSSWLTTTRCLLSSIAGPGIRPTTWIGARLSVGKSASMRSCASATAPCRSLSLLGRSSTRSPPRTLTDRVAISILCR